MTTFRSDSFYLNEIEAAARECLEFAGNLGFGDFVNDRKTRAAVIWQICVIGEAANQTSLTTRQQAPEIPWRPMIDMRNKLIHDYYEIKDEEVWRVVHEDLPSLIASIGRLLNSPNDDLR